MHQWYVFLIPKNSLASRIRTRFSLFTESNRGQKARNCGFGLVNSLGSWETARFFENTVQIVENHSLVGPVLVSRKRTNIDDFASLKKMNARSFLMHFRFVLNLSQVRIFYVPYFINSILFANNLIKYPPESFLSRDCTTRSLLQPHKPRLWLIWNE